MHAAITFVAVARKPPASHHARTNAWRGVARMLRCALDGLVAALCIALPAAQAVAEERYEQGLLWRVSREGVAPSYLFGTMHLADPRLLELPATADKAFREARSFVLEMYPDRAVARRFSEASLLDGGRRLSQLMTPEDFARLAERLAGRGFETGHVQRLKPWAALLLATGVDGQGGESLDISLYVRARFANKRIEELDSVEEQIAVFDGIPLETQLALLEIALQRHDALRAEMEQGIAAYLRGDLAALAALSRRNGGATPQGRRHQALLEKKIVLDRSVVMAYRLQAHLRRGGVFAAVGALHLYGPRGLPALLRSEGWVVSRVE